MGLRTAPMTIFAKPFAFEELVARLQAAAAAAGNMPGLAPPLRQRDARYVAQQVFVDDVPQLFLRARSRRAAILMRSQRPRDVEEIGGDHLFGLSMDVGSNAVEVYIHRLRSSSPMPVPTYRFITIRGVAIYQRAARVAGGRSPPLA